MASEIGSAGCDNVYHASADARLQGRCAMSSVKRHSGQRADMDAMRAPAARATPTLQRFRGGPPADRGPRGAAVAGGLRAAVDARREPGQVAPRAHDAGSSRRSCSRRTRPGYRPFDPRSASSSTPTTTASATSIRAPERGLLSRPDLARCSRTARTSTRRCSDLLERAAARGRCGAGRARAAPRAAAPGAASSPT